MECEEIIEKLPAYLARRLNAHENGQIAMHLASCAGCREELTFYFEIKSLIERQLDVNETVLTSAFNKIPSSRRKSFSLFLQNEIYYSLKIVRQSISLAASLI